MNALTRFVISGRVFLAFLLTITLLASSGTVLAAECVVATAGNIINNPCFEDEADGLPMGWSQGSYLDTAEFTYPVSGFDGEDSKAAQVTITNHVGGDAKWHFELVTPVGDYREYAYSSKYKSNTVTRIALAEFDGVNWTFPEALNNIPASPDQWAHVGLTFTLKPTTVQFTLYHLVESQDGWLIIDNAKLTTVDPIEIHDMVPNHSVEEESPGNPDLPRGWIQAGYETAGSDITSNFEYIDGDGHNSDRSVKVTVSGFDAGEDADAKWMYAPQPIAIEDDRDYRFTAWYKTDTVPHVVAQFTMQDGSTKFLGLPNPQPENDPRDGDWNKYETEFSAPIGALQMTVFFLLRNNGFVQTDDYHVDKTYSYSPFERALITLTFDDGASINNTTMLPKLEELGIPTTQCYMTEALESNTEIAAAHAFFAAGHEICAHSVTHPFLTQLSTQEMRDELLGSQTFLQENVTDGTPVTSFASPFGDYNATVNDQIGDIFDLHRTVDEGYNSMDNLDKYRLRVQNMNPNTSLAEFQSWVNKAIEDKTWLVIVYHQIIPTGGVAEDFDTFKPDFDAQMDWLANRIAAAGDNTVAIKTLRDAYAETQGEPTTPPEDPETPPEESETPPNTPPSSGGSGGGSTGGGTSPTTPPNEDGEVLGSATSTPCYQFTRTLSIGSTGEDVVKLQQHLIGKGYLALGTPTGYFGPVTANAVRVFQEDNGIDAVGIVGPKTRAFLNDCENTPTTPALMTEAQRQELIAALTAQLNEILAQINQLLAERPSEE